ncbi:MAG: Nucleic acid binding OB-fold tRNA/helicase [Frankiales bacterium]|nr:Nucleic acid binding OB-fold tRNA/helicase [Frankiales bacterium]
MPGLLRKAVARWTEPDDAVASRELQSEVEEAGATPVTACQRGEPVCVAGTLRAVTLRPRAGVPTLEAELYDGSGSITLIWLGRRRIGGVVCGRSLVARGRLTVHEGRPTIYNAAYELRPSVG